MRRTTPELVTENANVAGLQGVLSDLELIYVWGEKLEPALVDMVGKQYPEVYLLDWLGTSETFLGIVRS